MYILARCFKQADKLAESHEALENGYIMSDGLGVAVNGMKVDGVPYLVKRIVSFDGLMASAGDKSI